MLIQGQVGPTSPQSIQPGTLPPVRLGQLGDVVVSELHGRFYEQAYRNNLFRSGTTAVQSGVATMGTTTGGSGTLAIAATATPMLGIWNPATSYVNVVLTQAQLSGFYNTVTTPQPFGGLIWYVGYGQTAISTGLTPFNSKTLQQTGSQVKAFNGGQALSGLTNTLTAMEAADFQSGGPVTYGTIANTTIAPALMFTQNFDGQLIVPPGGILALYNTTATTTFSYTGRLLWEEVPL